MKIKQSLLFSIVSATSFLQMFSPLLVVAQSESSSSIYQNCQRKKLAVVTIYSGSEIGSGSIIRSDGIIITNYHVIKQSLLTNGRKKIFVYLQNGETYSGELLHPIEEKKDLALVKINAQKSLETLIFDSNQRVRPGELVCAIGSPYNQPGRITQGNFEEFRSNGDLKSLVRILPGNSGGPLLNSRGKMIGVVKSAWYSSLGENSGVSFAVSAADALQFIQQSRIKLPAERTTTEESEVTPLPAFSKSLATPTLTNPLTTISIPKAQTGISSSQAANIPVTLRPLEEGLINSNNSRMPSFVVPTLPLDSPTQYNP